MKSDSIVSCEFDYSFVGSVRNAIGVAVEKIKDGYYIKHLCVLDEKLKEAVEKLEKQEKLQEKMSLEERLSEVECELRRLR